MNRIVFESGLGRGCLSRGSRNRRLRPSVLALEGRTLLSTFTVGSTADDGSTGTLRWAIGQANSDQGADTIAFTSLFNTPQTISLTGGPLGLTGTAMTTITGPGANLLTVSGKFQASRVFDVPGGSAAISGLSITGGSADIGAGLRNDGGTLSLTFATVSGNTASQQGGGLATRFGGKTTLSNVTVDGNTAPAGSGLVSSDSTLTVNNCTVSGNTTTGQGGGLLNSGGTATLTDATVAANTAGTDGGGLSNDHAGTATLINCTVSGNSSSGGKSGVVNQATLSMTNTIISGNKYGDVLGSYTGGSNLIGGAPLLAPLGNYDGSTQTMALLPGSPAIGGGASGAGIPFMDQRGLPRTGLVDIGAFQSQGFTVTPVAGSAKQSAPINAQFANPLAVTVQPVNPVEPVDGGVVNFAVTTASGASAALSSATATIQGGQASITATANATPGTDLVTATAIGAPQVGFLLTNTEAPSLRLTTSRDVVNPVDSLTSLREAVAFANSHPGPDTISLDPAAFGSKRETIVLTGGPLVLTDPATTTIVGPGAKRLTISGGGNGRVFDVEGGSLALEGLTISGGRANRGGGIRNEGGTLALDRVVLSGNHARVGGALFNDGTATLTHVVLRSNSARVGPGLFSTRQATLTRRGLSSPAATGQILIENFNGTGRVPTNWNQFAGQPGDVVEKPHNLTITDSTGNSAGIVSTAKTVPFNPVGAKTTNVAQINSLNASGNAIFGLIGLNAQDSPAGYLAAGIDAHGNVFIVSSVAPTLKLTSKLIGVVKGYSGKSITLTFTVKSMGVEVDGGGFKSGLIPFKDLSNFSLAAAFPNGNARPALGAASQPGQTGGAASFESINVSTA